MKGETLSGDVYVVIHFASWDHLCLCYRVMREELPASQECAILFTNTFSAL